MKPLTEFINESLIWNGWKSASKTSKYIAIKGNCRWMFQSNDTNLKIHFDCDGWYVGTNGTIIIFWSPKCDWMVYAYISELRERKFVWSLVGMDKSLTDPSAVCTKILDHFDRYCADNATVPELDKIDTPVQARMYISMIIEQ